MIVRLPNWLGDTVMAEPAIRALRAASPGTRLLLAGPWATLLGGQGLAEDLVTYPRTWRGRLALVPALRRFAAEVAVLLPNSLEAALAARCWRARRRIGFCAGGRAALLTDALPLPEPREHQVDEYLRLVAPLGAKASRRTPELDAPARDSVERARARALLAEADAAPSGPRIGFHVGAAYGPAKLWPAARVAEFCAMARAEGATPVLLGPPTDEAVARDVMRRTRVASLVGRDTPSLLPALLAELDLLVAGDTGVGHLAAALGRPVVTLFGPTDPALSAPRGRTAVVRHAVACAPCFRRTCPIDHPCMEGIEPREVMAQALALLGRAP